MLEIFLKRSHTTVFINKLCGAKCPRNYMVSHAFRLGCYCLCLDSSSLIGSSCSNLYLKMQVEDLYTSRYNFTPDRHCHYTNDYTWVMELLNGSESSKCTKLIMMEFSNINLIPFWSICTYWSGHSVCQLMDLEPHKQNSISP